PDHAGGRGVDRGAAGGAVPRDRAADDPDPGDLPGRGRGDDGRVGGGADRAAVERDRQPDLFQFDQRQQRDGDDHGDVRDRDGPGPGGGGGAEPAVQGRAAPARAGGAPGPAGGQG